VIEHEAVGMHPPRVQCENCQALEAGPEEVIEMVPPKLVPPIYVPHVYPQHPWPWGWDVICNGSDVKVTVGDLPANTQTTLSTEQIQNLQCFGQFTLLGADYTAGSS
jgi:hypothetical protein